WWATAVIAPQLPMQPFFIVLALHMLVSGSSVATGATIMAASTPTRIIGKVSSIQFFLNGLIALGLGPIVVAVVSDRFFSAAGDKSLADALSAVSFVYGALGFVTL